MDPITFHPATEGDADLLRDITREAYAAWVPVLGREPMPMQVDYEAALKEHHFILARRGDAALGLIETVQHPDHLWVQNLAVRVAAQGQGLGKMLLGMAEAQAKTEDLPSVQLLTNALMTTNLAFYARRGYRILREKPFMGGVTAYLGKDLPTGSRA